MISIFEFYEKMELSVTYVRCFSQFLLTMGKVTAFIHNAVAIIVEVPTPLCLVPHVNATLSLLLLILAVVYAIVHHWHLWRSHNVLVHHVLVCIVEYLILVRLNHGWINLSHWLLLLIKVLLLHLLVWSLDLLFKEYMVGLL